MLFGVELIKSGVYFDMPYSYSRTNQLIQASSPYGQQAGLEQLYFAQLISVSAVTEHELRVKEIIETHARQKNQDFGEYVKNKFSKLNGRIKKENLEEYANDFGVLYKNELKRKLNELTNNSLSNGLPDPISDYDSLINNRHTFVHAGRFSVSYNDIVRYFYNSIIVLDKLEESLVV